MAKYEISLQSGILTAKSAHELVKKIEAEADFWSFFSTISKSTFAPQSHYTPQWVHEALSHIKQIAEFWPKHLAEAKTIATGGEAAFQKLKTTIENEKTKPPHSASKVGSLAKRLAEKGNLQEAVSLLVGASGMAFTQLAAATNQNNGHGAYISYARSLATFIDLEAASTGEPEAHTQAEIDAKVIESISNDMGLLFAKASSEKDHLIARTTQASEKILEKMRRLRESEIRHFRKTRAEERELRQQQVDELNTLIETYNAHLRLKRPVELWKERNIEHDKSAHSAWNKFFCGALLLGVSAACVAYLLGAQIAQSFVMPGCEIGTEPQCSRISARGPLNVSLLLIVTTTWLWYLRLQMRIFLSERHLALDARERMAFAETYLSLLKGAEVSREQETVVLQSLMRPTQDGIIKDESGPDFAISSLLARALERK